MDNLGILLALIALTLLVWFWADSMRARERALRASASACGEIDAQLLDQSVALRRIGITRNRNRGATFIRTYRFEYTVDGTNRLRGSVVIRGHRVETVVLQSPDGVNQFAQNKSHQ